MSVSPVDRVAACGIRFRFQDDFRFFVWGQFVAASAQGGIHKGKRLGLGNTFIGGNKGEAARQKTTLRGAIARPCPFFFLSPGYFISAADAFAVVALDNNQRNVRDAISSARIPWPVHSRGNWRIGRIVLRFPRPFLFYISPHFSPFYHCGFKLFISFTSFFLCSFASIFIWSSLFYLFSFFLFYVVSIYILNCSP